MMEVLEVISRIPWAFHELVDATFNISIILKMFETTSFRCKPRKRDSRLLASGLTSPFLCLAFQTAEACIQGEISTYN